MFDSRSSTDVFEFMYKGVVFTWSHDVETTFLIAVSFNEDCEYNPWLYGREETFIFPAETTFKHELLAVIIGEKISSGVSMDWFDNYVYFREKIPGTYPPFYFFMFTAIII